MKSFAKKAVVLMPVMLLSLTACGKLSEDQAKERAKGYNLAAVQEKYASVDIKSEIKVNKRTGVFEEGGLMSSMADTLIDVFEGENGDGQDVSEGFMGELTFDSGDLGKEVEVEYYGYKKTGLKITVNGKTDETTEGITEKIEVHETIFVLDDGRMEKGNGSMKMNVSGTYMGLSMEGVLDFSFKVSYSWNKK